MGDFNFTEVPKKDWPLTFNPPVKVFKSTKFLVQIYPEKNDIMRLSVLNVNRDKKSKTWTDGIKWDELQAIKSAVGYGDLCAVEVYPEDENIVNVAAIRHLFVLPVRPDYVWVKNDN